MCLLLSPAPHESMVGISLNRICGKLCCLQGCTSPDDQIDYSDNRHSLFADSLKAIQGEITIQAENGETRVLRSAPDWTESAIIGDHLWVSSSTSGSDLCYVGENQCSKTGPRLCCPACKVTAHTGCISILIDKMKFQCKPTFKDGVRQCREQTFVKHHWVHRRHEKGRCRCCGKSFQSKLSFGNKEIVAISCSWCKAAYHNKDPCFKKHQLVDEICKLGMYCDILVPPSWIVKLPRKGSFKSSIRRAPRNKRLSSKKRSKKESSTANLLTVASSNVADSRGLISPAGSISTVNSSVSSLSASSGNASSSVMLGVENLQAAFHPKPQQDSLLAVQSLSPPSPTPLPPPQSQSESSTSSSLSSKPLTQHNLNDAGVASYTPSHHPSNHSQYLHHFHSKHNQSETPTSAIYAGTPSSTAVGINRRHHRRHSHATVSSSSLTPGLLCADAHQPINSTSHLLHHISRSFAIKPIPSANLKPLLVFINPKSGGNQGSKLIQKFLWHLNPRQVFDLSQCGPRLGLDLYKKVYNLRILACGGDGTVGWIMSAIDEIRIQPTPPISVLPLGTGNDLARAFGWGGSYTDEPVSKILCNIQEGEVVQLDRWNLVVKQNSAVGNLPLEDTKGAKAELPLQVINNYFSIGVDAHIALSFHEAREAHPERFNSRLRNKMFYGQAGGKDLLQRKWKDLCNYVQLVCDGYDYTSRLKELKVHSVLFLNIPSYSGGTRPWATTDPSYRTPSTSDGLIEVIGLTTYQLPLLQAGGHGTCIAQCKSATITTSRTIPMQVDGEPCRLLPSVIELNIRNQVNLIAKTKSINPTIGQIPTLEKISLKVRKLNLSDYETYHYDMERYKEISTLLGTIIIETNLELIHVRTKINELMKEKGLCLVGVLDSASAQALAVAGLSAEEASAALCASSLSGSSPNKISPTSSSIPSTSFDSPAYVSSATSSSASSKFVSNDWCFVDSCTAERFFRIDRAQEHLHYVVDVCNEDLYILDPQFDEKDNIDLFSSEEVIADVVSRELNQSVGDNVDASNIRLCLPECHSDQTSDNLTVDSLPITSSSCSGEEFSPLNSTNTTENATFYISTTNSNCVEDTAPSSSKQQVPSTLSLESNQSNSPKSSSSLNKNKLKLLNIVDNNCNNHSSLHHQSSSISSDANFKYSDRPVSGSPENKVTSIGSKSPIDPTYSAYLAPNNQNGSLGLSPLSSPSAYSIDSPPRSPRRHQRVSHSTSASLFPVNQLIAAAQNGDVSLLKQLHHKGVNLMMIDDKGMSALHYAAMSGHESVVSFLLNAFTAEMIDLADSKHGHTALHKAVICGHRNICTMLMVRGAKLSILDRHGRSAEQLALNLGYSELAAALSHLYKASSKESTV